MRNILKRSNLPEIPGSIPVSRGVSNPRQPDRYIIDTISQNDLKNVDNL